VAGMFLPPHGWPPQRLAQAWDHGGRRSVNRGDQKKKREEEEREKGKDPGNRKRFTFSWAPEEQT